MNKTTDNKPTIGKVYKDKAFLVGAFLGGPLVAGYLFSENFKALGQSERIKPTWIITILATVVIFGGAFLIPENVNIPRQLIPIAYTIIALSLFKKYQEKNISTYIKEGGIIFSWWRVFAVSIVGLIITIIPFFGLVYTADAIDQANISTKTYGLTVKHEIDFDKTNISEAEIDEIADGFIEIGFFDLSIAKYLYIAKNENTYEISISVIKGIENDPEGLQHFMTLRDQIDRYLITKDVEIKLTVDYLDNVVKVLK